MDYNKHIKRLISLNLLLVIILIELFSFLPFILSVKAATIPVYAPVAIKEFIQTDWSGGWGLPSSTDAWVWNKYSTSEWTSNLDTSGWQLQLKPWATTDISYPSYDVIHQALAVGAMHSHDSSMNNLFDGVDSWNYTFQWAPINRVVANFPQDKYTDPLLFVEPWVQQDPGTTEWLYYGLKVTLKKLTPISKIRFNLYDNDGRKYTRYMIKWSNDDINYSDIIKMPDNISVDYNGWQDIAVSNTPYKYFKFYFDGYKSTGFTQATSTEVTNSWETLGDVLTWEKQLHILIKELEIYDATNTNIVKNWWNVLNNPWPHYQQKIIDTNPWTQYRQWVNTAWWLAVVNTIDLLASRPLSGVNLYLRQWDIRRQYWYRIDVSNDNTTWTTKIDRTAWNADPKWYHGKQEIKFTSIENWRYIKIYGWKWEFSPDLTRWNWAGHTSFHITQVQPLTPYYYAWVESPVIDFWDNREFKRVTVQWQYDTFWKEIKILVRTWDTSSYNAQYWSQRADVMGNIPNYLQNKRYLQYKIQLLSRDANTTPVIDDITISHKSYRQDVDTYTGNYSNDNHVPMKWDIVKPVESYRYNLWWVQDKEDTIVEDIDKDGVVDLIMLQWWRIIAKRWYSLDVNRATPYVDDIIYDTPNRWWTRLFWLHDFNKDGKKEILLWNESAWYISIVDLETGNILWTANTPWFSAGYERWMQNGISVTDLEDDGYLEIFYAWFGWIDTNSKTRMFSFKNWFSQNSMSLIADWGNLIWEKPYIFRRRHTHHILWISDFISGNNVKEIVTTNEHSILVRDVTTGDNIGTFKLPIPWYDKWLEDSYILYPQNTVSHGNILFDDVEATDGNNWIHVFDGNISDVDKKTTFSETFQKNHIIIDLGASTAFTQLKARFWRGQGPLDRQHNILWEWSNDRNSTSGTWTWTKIQDWQKDTYGDYNDTRYCATRCDTWTLPSKNYRFLRLKTTGSQWYTWRWMWISEIDILNNWVSIKSSIADNTKTYVFPRNATYHYSTGDFKDIDGDNISELIVRSERSSGHAYDWRNSWRWVLKFGPSNDLKQTKWVWAEKWKDYDGSRRTEWWRGTLPQDDFDGDGKKDLVTWHHRNNAEWNWKTYIHDIETGKRKIIKVKYQDQDKASIGILNGEAKTNYRLYNVLCPNNLRQNASEDDKKRALCEIANFEFETPQTLDKIDIRFYETRSFYNYKIEATEDGSNWVSLTPASTENNTTANFSWWKSNTFTQKTYKALRISLSKNANDLNAPRAILQWLKLFNGWTDLTPTLKDKIYVYKTDGALPWYWHSESWMYGPIQTIGTDKVIPMYLGQRHGMYKINQTKTWPNGVYFDLMYNFNKTVSANWTLYSENKSKTSDTWGLSIANTLGRNTPRVPIQPIWDGSIGDYIITDGYNVKMIDGWNGSEKANFPYPTSWANSLLYYGNLWKDLWIWFIQSFWNGKTRMISLTSRTQLNEINTWNYYNNDIIVTDMNNDGIQEIITKDGYNDRVVLDIASASPIQSPNKIWNGNPRPYRSVGGTVLSDENVVWSNQWKVVAFDDRRNYLWILAWSFTWTKYAIKTWYRSMLAWNPYWDKLSKWYYAFSASYSIPSRRAPTDFWYDMKNTKANSYRQQRQWFVTKSKLELAWTIWSKIYNGIYYFHNSQHFGYDYDNDGYDDIVLNHAYHYPVFVSGKDGLPLKMIQDYYTGDWHPLVWQFDNDSELELYWQTSREPVVINRINPKDAYMERSAEWGGVTKNHWKMGIIDIDNDGVWETFAQVRDGRILIHGKNMDLVKAFYLFEWNISTTPIIWSAFANSITSIDIDWDGKQNLVISWNDGYIYAINPNVDMTIGANMTWEWPTKAILWSYKVWANVSRLAFADIRNRGKTDIVFSGWDWFVRVLTQASIIKPQKVNDGPTVWVNLEFTQDITKIGANWTSVPWAKWYIVKFISDTGQEIVSEKPVVADANGNIPTQILVDGIWLQVWRKYFAMVKAFDGWWVSEYTISDGIEVVWFSITKQVRNASDPNSQFQNEITVWPWEMVQYKITVTNKTNRIAWGGKFNMVNPLLPVEVTSCTGLDYCEDRAIVVEDYMPQWFTYIAWSTVINWYSRSNEIPPFFLFDTTNTQTSLPTVAGSVLRWKLPKWDIINPYGWTLELTFTARVK